MCVCVCVCKVSESNEKLYFYCVPNIVSSGKCPINDVVDPKRIDYCPCESGVKFGLFLNGVI